MAQLTLNSYNPDRVCRDIQKLLYEAYQKATCCNGPYPNPNVRQAVWDEFNKLAKKLFNNKIKVK
jgi:hypothetical protein